MQKKYKIDGMHCPSCVVLIKETLEETDGIISADVKEGSAKVTFDSGKVSEDTIKKVIKNEGYDVI